MQAPMTREEVFYAEEAIARGEPCPGCGEEWLPLPSGYELVHGPHCNYLATVDYEAAFVEAVRLIEEALRT